MSNLNLLLAWRNLWRHRRRTWLTMGAMIFSNTLLVFMMALQFGSYSMMIDNSLRAFSGHLQIQAPDYFSEQKMRMVVPQVHSLAQSTRELLGTPNVAPRAVGFAMASSKERSFGIQITGVEPEAESRVSSIPGLVSEGRYLQPSTDDIVIGSVLARNLKVGLGDEVTLLGSGYDGSFAAAVLTVVGIFNSGMVDLDRSVAQMPITTFQTVFSMGNAGHSVVIAAPNLDTVPIWQDQLQAALKDQKLAVLDWDQLNPGLKQAIQADLSSAAFMYAVLVILVAFSVLNTQLMSVLERTREFGIMLALGLKPSRIGRLVMQETALLASLGTLLGILAGGAIVAYLSFAGFSYPGMEEMAGKFNLPSRIYPSVNWLTLLAGPLCVFIGAMLAAIYPALKIYGLHPVQAMRAV